MIEVQWSVDAQDQWVASIREGRRIDGRVFYSRSLSDCMMVVDYRQKMMHYLPAFLREYPAEIGKLGELGFRYVIAADPVMILQPKVSNA